MTHSHEDFMRGLGFKLARLADRIEEDLHGLIDRVSKDPEGCGDFCRELCEARQDAALIALAFWAAGQPEVAHDLLGPCDRLGRGLLSSFDMALDYAGDWYSLRLYKAATESPAVWWLPNVHSFSEPSVSLSELLGGT